MMIPATLENSPGWKLQSWIQGRLLAAGITHQILGEDTGAELPEGKHLLISLDNPEPMPAFADDFPGVSPLQATGIIALVQPAILKTTNTPEAVAAFDKEGRAVIDVFRGSDFLQPALGDLLVVDFIKYLKEGSDTSDDSGRKLRVYAGFFSFEFRELAQPVE